METAKDGAKDPKKGDGHTIAMRESQLDEILLRLAAEGEFVTKQQLMLQLESRLGLPIEIVKDDYGQDEECIYIAPRIRYPNTVGSAKCEYEGCNNTCYYSSQPPKGAKIYCDLHIPTPKPKFDA